MALILIGRLQAATDQTMATLVREPGSGAQSAVDSRIVAVAASIIAGDPSIKAAAASAVAGAAAEGGFLTLRETGAVRTTAATEPGYSEVVLSFDYRRVGGTPRYDIAPNGRVVVSELPHTNGGIVDVSSDYRRMERADTGVGFSRLVMWADSMGTDYGTPGQSRIGEIAQELGVVGIDQGIAGDTPHEIGWRMGALKWTVTIPDGVIPASGQVPVTVAPSDGYYNARTWVATLPDIDGRIVTVRLAHPVTSMGGTPAWTIEQVGGTGPVQVLPRTRVKYLRDGGLEALPAVIWMGRNDSSVSSPIERQLERLETTLSAMIREHRDPLRRLIILPVWNRTTEPQGSPAYERVMAQNEVIARVGGSMFYDLRRDIIDHGLDAVGLTPTSEDTAMIAQDVPPPSLLGDITHPNSPGSRAVGKLVGNDAKGRNW